MQMPNNYANTKAMGDFTPVEVGGHKANIVQVREMKNKNGGDMIVVLLDFDGMDKQPHYFSDMYKADDREEKKWPNAGTVYINVLDREGNCSRSFKTFCTCVENSNNGFEVRWGEGFAAQFKGAKVGAVYGMVEEFYNGKTSKRSKMRWFTGYEDALEAAVPEEKLLPTSTAADGFGSSGFYGNEQIPF